MNSLHLEHFKRVNNRLAPSSLGKDELVTMDNLVLNYQAGKPVKRGHFSKYDAGVSAGADILQLADMEDSSGQQRIVAAVADEVRVYNPAANTWADYIISLTSGFKFRMIPFADTYIFLFNTDNDPVQAFNDISNYYNLELLVPSVTAIQSFHDNGGNLTQNTLYKYVIVGVTEDGQYSPPSRPFTHIYANTAYRTTDNDTASTKVYFKNLPYVADSRVVSRLLFRTKADANIQISADGYKTGEVYYLLATLDNDSAGSQFQTEFDDNVSDDDLNTEVAIYLNTPTRAKYGCLNNGRLFMGNFSQVNYNHFSPPSTQTGGTPPSGYTDGVELSIVDTAGGGGTLAAATQYEYRIHYVDKLGRYSRYYHDISTTTSGAANHHLQIYHIGAVDIDTAEIIPRIAIFRRTGGSGSYFLIGEFSITGFADLTGVRITVFTGGNSIIDWGATQTATAWVDPATVINAEPSAICFSDIDAPSTIREENKRQIFDDDAQAITGVFDDTDGVVIFKENSICKAYTQGSPNNWSVYKFVDNIGAHSETIRRLGSTFYFIHNNKAYRWNVGRNQPEDIGYLFQNILDGIVTFHDSAINNDWWVLQVKDSTTYRTIIYDIKLDTWYRFTRTQTGTEDFKAVHFTEYGSSEEFLSNCDDFITIYNQLSSSSSATRADTETGSTVQITPEARTKTFTFQDGITKARLRRGDLEYNKVTGQDTSLTVTTTTASSLFTDNTSSGVKLYEPSFASVAKTRNVYFTFAGAGFLEWGQFRCEYRPIKEGYAVQR